MSQYPNQGNYPPQQPRQAPPPQYQQQPGGYPPQPQYQQPGGYPPQQPQYQGQQYGYGAPRPAAPVKPPANPLLYLIPIVGVIIMAVGVFLPWFTMNIQGGTGIGSGSIGMDGLGNLSGSADLISALTASTGKPGAKDGTLVLGLAVIVLVLCLLGFFIKSRGFAIAAIVFGVFSLGLAIFEVTDISKSVNDITAQGAGFLTATTGIGTYVVLVGAIVILLGAIIATAFFRKKRA